MRTKLITFYSLSSYWSVAPGHIRKMNTYEIANGLSKRAKESICVAYLQHSHFLFLTLSNWPILISNFFLKPQLTIRNIFILKLRTYIHKVTPYICTVQALHKISRTSRWIGANTYAKFCAPCGIPCMCMYMWVYDKYAWIY